MKFIKDADGFYVDVEKATAFAVVPYRSVNGNLLWADASLFIGELKYKLGRFDDEAEAQAWLDDFVAKLNAEAIT